MAPIRDKNGTHRMAIGPKREDISKFLVRIKITKAVSTMFL
jgi:hypothetical protein